MNIFAKNLHHIFLTGTGKLPPGRLSPNKFLPGLGLGFGLRLGSGAIFLVPFLTGFKQLSGLKQPTN